MTEFASTATGITLIGMPGAGKSTVGVLLSKRLGLGFIDSDLSIQVRTGQLLQDIVDQQGYLALREIEQQVLCEIDPQAQVVATGGSAVYSDIAMQHLLQTSTVVYLQTSLAALRDRIEDYDRRGIARRPDQSFESLFEERTALYERYAQVTVDAGLAAEQVARTIEQLWRHPR